MLSPIVASPVVRCDDGSAFVECRELGDQGVVVSLASGAGVLAAQHLPGRSEVEANRYARISCVGSVLTVGMLCVRSDKLGGTGQSKAKHAGIGGMSPRCSRFYIGRSLFVVAGAGQWLQKSTNCRTRAARSSAASVSLS